jgi:hypothetical protein
MGEGEASTAVVNAVLFFPPFAAFLIQISAKGWGTRPLFSFAGSFVGVFLATVAVDGMAYPVAFILLGA